jgi:site-specific recombinase XerD
VYLDKKTLEELKSWHNSYYANGNWLWYGTEGSKMSYVVYNRIFRTYFGKGSHRIRASLATYLISNGVGIKDVADILGHENIGTTMKYAACIKSRIKDIHTQKNPFSI